MVARFQEGIVWIGICAVWYDSRLIGKGVAVCVCHEDCEIEREQTGKGFGAAYRCRDNEENMMRLMLEKRQSWAWTEFGIEVRLSCLGIDWRLIILYENLIRCCDIVASP